MEARIPLAVVAAVVLVASAPRAQAQYASAAGAPWKAPVSAASAQAPPPSFSMGADSCSSPHTSAGIGDATNVPFTTGTTGSTGQNEANCLVFGLRGIDRDVWFGWTASADGIAVLETCGGGDVDTKVAVWPDFEPASCPPNGASIACNDDVCLLQSAVAWPITSGTTYTIQIGTFPGAPGGTGTFDIEQRLPPPCGQADDGDTESAFGLVAGGEIGWLVRVATGAGTCMPAWDWIDSAYGSALFPGSVTNGSASRLAVYRDSVQDGDPTSGLTLELSLATVVTNGDTDVLNRVPLATAIQKPAPTDAWVLVTANQVAGQFPAPMDQTPPCDVLGVWTVGSTLGPGTLNLANLNANDHPPQRMSTLGLPTNWLLRIGSSGGGGPRPTIALTSIAGARESAVGNFAQLADPNSAGRLFIDSVAGGALLANPDQQWVELEALLGPADVDPALFEVRWKAYDLDDPADHFDVDPFDGGNPLGGTPLGGDNLDPLPVQNGVSEHFFFAASHAISGIASAGSSPADPDRVIGTAVTQLGADRRTTVRFRYGDEGGDNYRIEAVCVRKATQAEETLAASGPLTVWRLRYVHVAAMTKPSDDRRPPVANLPTSKSPAVAPGANGHCDSYLAGDDRYTDDAATSVRVGANLVADTPLHNGGGSYFPGANAATLLAALRASFASSDPNHALYVDAVIESTFIGTTYDGLLERATGANANTEQHAYSREHTTYHQGPGNDVHPRNAYQLLGIRTLGALSGLHGSAVVAPHAFVDLLAIVQDYAALGPGAVLDEVRSNAVHELGHVLVPRASDDLHATHSLPPFDVCCGRTSGGQGLEWCPRHSRRLRRNITRAFAAHDDALPHPAESERDSD